MVEVDCRRIQSRASPALISQSLILDGIDSTDQTRGGVEGQTTKHVVVPSGGSGCAEQWMEPRDNQAADPIGPDDTGTWEVRQREAGFREPHKHLSQFRALSYRAVRSA